MNKNNKELNNEMFKSIVYFLHTYFSDNRENLTNQDWFLHQVLTNILCGMNLSSIRLYFTKEQLSTYPLSRKLIDEIYS